MANHKSAIKRAKQNQVRKIRNKSIRTRVKNVIKDVRAAIEENSPEKGQAAMAKAIPTIRKASKKGAIHRKNAARKISRLSRQVNALAS